MTLILFCSVLTHVILSIFMLFTTSKFYPVNLHHSSYMYKYVCTNKIENNVDPDLMASSEASKSGSTVV